MDGIPINGQSRPVIMCQFGKFTGKPMFNEKNEYPKDLISTTDIIKTTKTIIPELGK